MLGLGLPPEESGEGGVSGGLFEFLSASQDSLFFFLRLSGRSTLRVFSRWFQDSHPSGGGDVLGQHDE